METSLARDLMSDEEWAFHPRVILASRAPNGRKPLNHRRVLDGTFRIARTGSPWQDPPEEFGKWSSVYRQRWTMAKLWENILIALNGSGLVLNALQMIGSTIVCAHHPAAAAKRETPRQGCAFRAVASRSGSTSASTPQVSPGGRTSHRGTLWTIRASIQSWTTSCPSPASCLRIVAMGLTRIKKP